MSLLILLLNILLVIAFCALLYFIAVWVLGLLGVAFPANILKIIIVIVALILVIGVLAGGPMWNWRLA